MSAELVGREADRRRLHKAVHDPDTGAIILRGPAGAGKSALAQALLSDLTGEGFLVGMGKYAEVAARQSFGPVVQALAEAVSGALDQLYDPAAGLESLSQALGPSAAVLSQAGFRVPGLPEREASDVAGQREGAVRLVSAILRVVEWLQGFGAPITLLIDDWRRAALEVRRLLIALLARSGETNLTLILTERDELPPDPMALRQDVLQVVLGDLDEALRLELFARALQSAEAAKVVCEWLGPDCPRLPFDILEAARQVQESGALVGAGPGLSIDPERLAQSDRPDLARSIIRRLEASTPDARRLALALALWGDSAPIRPLAEAMDLRQARLEAAASRLQAVGLVRQKGPDVKFRHDRLREGVLAVSTGEARQELAAELAERLVRAGDADPNLRDVALRLRLLAGVDAASPKDWRDRFARGAAEARARADEQAANSYAETAWRLFLAERPSDPASERRILREAVLAAADRHEADTVIARVRMMVQRSHDESELGEAYEIGIVALRLANDFDRGWAIGREGMARFGLKLPRTAGAAALIWSALRWRLVRLWDRLGDPGAPVAASAEAFTRVAHAAATLVYERDPAMTALIALRGLARLPGTARRGPYWLAVQTFVCAMMGQFEEAARLGELVVSGGRPAGFGASSALYRALYWGVIWRQPQAELRARCHEVRDLAIGEGDLVAAATALRNSMMLGWRTLPTLDGLDREIAAIERELDWLGEPTAQAQANELRRIIRRLQQRGGPPDIRFAEEIATDDRLATLPRAVLAMEVASLSGDWGAARSLARRLAHLKAGFDSHPGGVIWRFHEGVWRLKTGGRLSSADLRYVRRAARLNPVDHRHKALVLEAELLRSEGRPACLGAYAIAVEAASASSSRMEAAMAAELASQAAREFGHPKLAERYLERAQEIWREWGAVAKLRRPAAGAAAGHALPQLLEAQAQAAAARREDRAKSRLLADVAHELRTPLQGMQGLLDLAAEDRATLDLEAFRDVFASLKVVIDDLTDYGALTSGEAPTVEAATSLTELVRSEFSVAAGHPALREAQLALEIGDGVPEAVATDPARVRQVVRNLLSNAAKYGGGRFVRLELEAQPAAPGEARIRITVEDSGPGLKDGDALLIFEPFERGARQGDGKGLGLGLALSRKIARRLGGDLNAENRDEGGARFVFTFVGRIARPAPQPASGRVGPLRILLAEDVDLSRRALAAILRREAHEVVEARDGLEALSAARKGGFDLMILDMAMPGASGVEVLLGLEPADRPRSVLLTASSGEEVAAEAGVAGFDLVLRKPLSASELDSALAELFLTRAPDETPLVGISEELRQLTEAARVELQTRITDLNLRLADQHAAENAAEAHRIAGLAAQFGWPAIAEEAEAVERAFKRGDAQAPALCQALGASAAGLIREAEVA